MSEREDEGTERWRGKVDAVLDTVKAQLHTISAKLDGTDVRINTLDLKVQANAVKIAIYAALAAFIGGGVMSIVVGFVLTRLK